MNVTPPGGMTDLGAIILGLILLATVILTVSALRRAIKARESIWLLLIVFLPPLGSILTLFALDNSGRRRATTLNRGAQQIAAEQPAKRPESN